ncbi:EpaQ family protein [Enterococcus durans]|uniref:EpaQ family protein n=1 Tax=Enterococcus durans TaxID=53345 RepID=UPI00226D26F9|nr:EpaQ family protein [Enterococcus durans]MDB1683622.1 EpaQ family protein [Enterococcus durans]
MINKMSALLLLLLVSAIFFIWTVGLSVPSATFLYNNSSLLVTYGIFILFALNLYKIRGFDFFYLAIAIMIYFFYAHFRDVRDSSIYIDLLIPLIVALVLIVKWIEFDKLDRAVYMLVFYIFLGITVYRVFTEIKVPEGQSIWMPSNKLSDIWINTNTIGSSLMMLSLLISSFASSFERWYVHLLGVPALVAGILGIWVCQSRGALIAMIVFVLLDIWPKQFFKTIRAPFLGYFAVAVLALPLSFLAAVSEKVNIFTGREEIWLKFYDTIAEKSQQVWFGMKPFIFQRGTQYLGNHNSYNSFLNLYGLVGVVIAAILLLIYVGRLTLNGDLSNGQVTFLWAFFAVMMQSFMEDTLTSFAWLPIVYILLAMTTHRYDLPKQQPELNAMPIETEEPTTSRVARHYEAMH